MFIALLLLLLLPLQAVAGDKILTLDEAIQEVLIVNQDVRAAGYRTEAAKARIPQAKALDDPMVGVMFEDVPFGDNVTHGEQINYRIEQKLPFPGKRHVRGKAARFDAEAAAANASGRVRDVLLDLKRTYYEVYRIERSLEVNRENQALLRQFLGSTETAYAAGKTTAANPLKAQVELSQLKNQEILLHQEHQTHMAHLTAILNRTDHEDLRLPSRLSWPRLKATLEDIEAMAVESRPELKELRAAEKRDRARVTSAKQGLIPDFALGFEYNQRPNREDAWTGTAMINLPVFFWSKNRGEIREAKASLQAAKAEHDSMEIHTRHELEQAYSGVTASQKVVASYEREILPQAKTTLEAARTAYASGDVDFLTLIDAARTYRDLKTSYYESQARLGMTFAELERLVGRDL
ncbi:MAG TPA: TolC family protein [bacterium]|nr:TolC family protein [bacterium]